MTYDAASQLTALTRYSDLAGSQLIVQSDYSYDSDGKLIALTHHRGATVIADYSWTYDAGDRNF